MTTGKIGEIINKVENWGRNHEVDFQQEGISIHQDLATLTRDYWADKNTEEQAEKALGYLLFVTILAAQELGTDLEKALDNIIKEEKK